MATTSTSTKSQNLGDTTQQAKGAVASGVEKVKDAVQSGAEKAKDYAQSGVEKAKDFAQTGMEKAKDYASAGVEKAKDLASTGAAQVREAASAGIEKAKDYAHSAGHMAENATSSMGSGFESLAGTIRQNAPHEGMMGNAASAVADSLEKGGRYLREEGLSGMADDITNTIRRNPLQSILVAVAVGFLLARATRS